MLVPNKNGTSRDYRFGFQGQEMDNELKGDGNSLNYTFRMHDPRVGRFFARDPLESKYPFYSPYQFSGNRVIDMIELEGLEPTYSACNDGEGAKAPCQDSPEDTTDHSWVSRDGTWQEQNIMVTHADLKSPTVSSRNSSNELLETIEYTLNLEGSTFGIDSMEELSGFVAETSFETGKFTSLAEKMNYSLKNLRNGNFKRLDKYTDKYILSKLGDDVKTATMLYGGNDVDIDYRGRGLIHTTWLDGYNALSTSYNDLYNTNFTFSTNPNLLSTDYKIAVRSALIFFQNHGIFNKKTFSIDRTNIQVNKYDEETFETRTKRYDDFLEILLNH
jgi:RHS repeat-associated protein